MNLPAFSVRRPVLMSMMTLIVVVVGLFSLWRLDIDMLPDITMPRATVRAGYEGASPEVMEKLVTQILEEIIATTPGVEELSSTSSQGNSRISVTFVWGTDIDKAALDLQAKIEDEISELPDDITRPRVSTFDTGSFPVVLLGIASTLDPVETTQLMEDEIRYRISRIPGVAQVDPWGSYDREVRVELDMDKLASLGVPLSAILDAIRQANVDRPAGEIEDARYEVRLRAPAQFESLDQIRDTVVANVDGSLITVGQIAKVTDTYERLSRIVRINGDLGLRLAVRKKPNANTVDVATRVLEEVEAINAQFPQIDIVPVLNQGNLIQRSIQNVARSVLYGGGLAVLVLLFFLRSVRSTVVISLAIPISIIATFSLVYFGGLTLNLMTLGGLALGVGMMVDSSIVVLENIYRRRHENAEPPATAAVRGAAEVGPALVASTLTTLVIFLPLVFVQGVTGLLFADLAYVVIFSLACSLIVSLSVVPMIAAKLVRDQTDAQEAAAASEKDNDGGKVGLVQAVSQFAKSGFDRLDNAYRDMLMSVLDRRLLVVALALTLLGGSVLLVPSIGTEFFPPTDEGQVTVTGEMELGTKLAIVDGQTKLIERVINESVPELEATISNVGASGWRPNSGARGRVQISLGPVSGRERSNVEVADDLRKRLTGNVPGMEIRVRAAQGQFLLDRLIGGDEGLSVEVRGYELETLKALAQQVGEVIADVPGISDVDVGRLAGLPQQHIEIDRKKAGDLGLTVADVARVVETAIAGRQAGEYRAQGNSYPIRVQLEDAQHMPMERVLDLVIPTPSGQRIVLANLIQTRPDTGPALIDRKDQQRLVTVSANVAGRDMGSVVQDMQVALDTIPRPAGYEFVIAGNYEQQQEAFNELIISFALAIVLVYMVLAGQYESLRDPLVVMASVPVAAVGVFVTLLLTNTTLNVQSYIGCIMLGGIVVNNAILLVDQAAVLRRHEGMNCRQAVAEAGRRRLRPILMTTLTTILGLLPLALGFGEGADAQAPLARAVIGGLAASTLITLGLVPALYSLIHRDDHGQANTNTTPAPQP